MKRISLRLNTDSINNAIKQLEDYSKYVVEKSELITQKLSDIGVKEAAIRFSSAMYDGENKPIVSTERTDSGYAIIAKGKAVCFIEFGAGVYYNGNEPYPNPPGRPQGIVNIGEYGKGGGKQNGWYYVDTTGEKHYTHGNPAAMPMWYATKEMESNVLRIAREVFQ